MDAGYPTTWRSRLDENPMVERDCVVAYFVVSRRREDNAEGGCGSGAVRYVAIIQNRGMSRSNRVYYTNTNTDSDREVLHVFLNGPGSGVGNVTAGVELWEMRFP